MIRRMLDSQLLIGGTSWLSDGEGQSEDVACHYIHQEVWKTKDAH